MTAMECTSLDWYEIESSYYFIYLHPKNHSYYTGKCLLSMQYIPIECVALGLVVFSNIIYYYL